MNKRVCTLIIKFISELPKNKITDVLGYQLLKPGTSIGANYSESQRAESLDDFIHKISIVEKETNETKYWLELLDDLNIGAVKHRALLLREVSELLAIFTSSGKTVKVNRTKRTSNKTNR